MAISGTIVGSYQASWESYKPYVKWTRTSYSTTGNGSSTVSVTFGMRKVAANSTSYSGYNTTLKLVINGTTYTRDITFDFRNSSYPSDHDITTISGITINHDANGNASFSISASHTTGISLGTGTVSGTATLDQIITCTAAKITSISPASMAFNSSGNLTISLSKGTNNDNTNCKYIFSYSCNGIVGNLETYQTSSKLASYSFSMPWDFSQIRGQTSNVTCTITLTTYWNNVSKGSSSNTFTIIIPQPASDFTIRSQEFYYFDTDYILNFTSTNSNYTYKLVGGGLNLDVASGDNTFQISSSQCPDATSKSIELQLVTYTGSVAFSNPSTKAITFNVPDTNNYKPNISGGLITYNNMYEDIYYFNGSRQSSLTITFSTFNAGTGASIQSLTSNNSNIIITAYDELAKTATLGLSGNVVSGQIIFTLTDSRNTSKEVNITFPDITVLDYVPLNIRNVKVNNEYQSSLYITFDLARTGGDEDVDYDRSTLVTNDIDYELELSNNTLVPQNYTASTDSKQITIIATLYGESITYSLYLPAQEKALNFSPNNKKIRVGNMAGDCVASFKLLTSSPDDWQSNYKDYYTRSGAGTSADPYIYIEITGDSAPTWATNTYYEDITSLGWLQTWGLIVGNFDLTLTADELAAIKTKFRM